jgi:cytochrome c oxidase subunit 1
MAVYLLLSIYKGRLAGSNPWGALTLDWTTTSPPDPHNFEGAPELKHDAYDYDKVKIKSTLE